MRRCRDKSSIGEGCLWVAGGGSSFGQFMLDDGSGQLCCEGQPVPLGQCGLGLLSVLPEAEGRPVDKQTLMRQGWLGQVVEDVNLSVQIAHLRKALGRRSDGEDCIVTVPRFGYQLAQEPPPPDAPGSVPMFLVRLF